MSKYHTVRNSALTFVLSVLVIHSAFLTSALAEEGMWTFDKPPLKQLKERYGFEPTREWLEHIRLSSVRFNDGGSGSFVSPHGLALTNHHVALGQLQKVSTAAKDYVKDGFYARTPAEELKCPDLELNVLVALEDVTARVQGAAKKGMSDEEALKARKAEMAAIEKQSTESTGLRSDVVTLYNGGEYWLYRYKKYTDIRLVFAPEQQIAFFGGDPDNFTYPRHDIDFALVRVYENDKPVENQHYLKWSAKGAAEGELVFVSGHPGSTDRQTPMVGLELQRDHLLPRAIKNRERRLAALRKYAAEGPEQSRQAQRPIFYLENTLKAFGGMYEGLKDPELISKKTTEENEFRRLVAGNAEWKRVYGSAWDEYATSTRNYLAQMKPYRYRRLTGSNLANLALQIVQYVAEVKKADGERLDGFHDAQLESTRFELLSPAPVYSGMEEALIANTLQEAVDQLGPNDPYVKGVLGGRSAAEVAKEAVAGTKLADPAFRKSLMDGGEPAVQASTDPLIALARRVDPFFREMHKWYEDKVESIEVSAGEKIGKARFAAFGKSAYPDATFTLRLSYGSVKGYPMNGTQAPPWTTFYGLYDRAYSFGLKDPYELPKRYLDGKNSLDLSTPLDFVSTCDIIGGNSGSPVVNRKGEFVGLIFDGNIESLVGDYVYSGEKNRAVAVHSLALIEVLRKLYDAGGLAGELTGKQ
ncbi:MAG: S46 family peptidase [Acidobacteria bacterium]|nr:S46 family peptidase [Acidobacteriota bacterium]